MTGRKPQGAWGAFMPMVTVGIVGASGGLGRALCAHLLARGDVVGAIGSSAARLDSLSSHLGDPESLRPFEADATDVSQLEEVVATLQGLDGPLYGWVNLAGSWAGGRPVASSDLAQLDAMLDSNLRTCYCGCRAVLPTLIANGRGKVVNVGARPAIVGGPSMAAYAAAKAAVVNLTASIAAEVVGAGVQVNAILPATIDTPANRGAMPLADTRGWVPAQSLADVIAFLLSPQSDAINGAAIPVYGPLPSGGAPGG